ncbi:MAG: ATP-binding protein, partial [Plesiomonas sp.]
TSVLLIVSSVLSVSALLGYRDANHETEELFDARLAQSARITLRLLNQYLELHPPRPSSGEIYPDWHPTTTVQTMAVQTTSATTHAATDSDDNDGSNDNDGSDEATPDGHQYERKLSFQLYDQQGNLLLRSPGAPDSPLLAPHAGFATTDNNGKHWRTFTLFDPQQQRWLVASEHSDIRRELADKIALRAIQPLLLTLPLLLFMLWLAILHALSPLTRLANAISERHPNNLRPLQPRDTTHELQPLINEINRLMATVEETLAREKQFTNEAAHELRTPLAVLALHCENALQADTPAQREQAMHKMQLALQRSERTIQQLLTLARLDNQNTTAHHERVALVPLLRTCIAQLAPFALQKQQEIDFVCIPHHATPIICGQPVLLDILFSNILDNAIRYTGHNGTIDIILEQKNSAVSVTIQDNGPGLSDEALRRICERFYRANTAPSENEPTDSARRNTDPQRGIIRTDGAGLGMAIVQNIAHHHGATLQITHRQSATTARLGLSVSLSFSCLPAAM